jgi:hypothetical protein
MSQETLRLILEQLNTDEEFRERMRDDWQNALYELELSPAEAAALASQDEDALRRLVGADVTALEGGFFGTDFICSLVCITTIDTPGSGRDTCPGSRQGCGTHNTHNCFVLIR